ncbi:hypothetical protein SY91_01741 [Burkholderia cenocepacia]|nr:hypothetical protein [Burkholderia cenocepacia]QND94342.1 hypothetical protein SY91_01741 [Burkholderia cenocepacia]
MMRAPLNSLPDWFPLAVLGALYLIACGVAPAYELLSGIAK